MLTSLLFPDHDKQTGQEIVDPRTMPKDESVPAALCQQPSKNPFRNSIVSQSSNTTASGSTHSQQHSIASNDSNMADGNNPASRRWSAESSHFDHTSPRTSSSSLPPSSRLLLSGAKSSETFREQELSRFYPTPPSRHVKAASDSTGMPSIALATSPASNQSSVDLSVSDNSSTSGTVDPWSMSLKVAQEHAICSDWLHKYDTPSFTFARSWKRRYIVLVDRTVYVFKTNKQPSVAREHFVLTDDTLVFVSDEFRKGYVLELRKPLCRWCMRCESAAQMKEWLQAMKKTVACEKLGYQGTLSAAILANLKLTDDGKLTTIHGPLPPLRPSNSLVSQLQNIHLAGDSFTDLPALRDARPMSAVQRSRISMPQARMSLSVEHLPTPSKWWKSHKDSDQDSGTLSHQPDPVERECAKRQSLAQIPGWEKRLPPQMPPPRTQLPPIPRSIPSPPVAPVPSSSKSVPTRRHVRRSAVKHTSPA